MLVETQGGQSNFYVPGLAQYGNEWQYFATDRLGSTRQLVDPVGQVLRSQTFDPFGNVLEQGGTGQSIFGYTGEQTDPTELVFLRARYYDPRVGRFLTEDSIIPEPLKSRGWNRYAYLGNNPVASTDPSGHCGPLQMAGVVDGSRDSIDIVCNGGGAVGRAAGRGGISRGGLIKAAGATGLGVVLGGTGVVIANEVLETTPGRAPEGLEQKAPPPEGPCSIDTGYHAGPDIQPKPYDFPPFSLLNDPLGDIFYGTPLDSGVPPLVVLTSYRGGKHGALESKQGMENHHLLPWRVLQRVSDITYYSGPAIQMEYDDHRKLQSTGRWNLLYKAAQLALALNGDYRAAIQMEIDDIRSVAGSKYDDAIDEALEYFPEEWLE